MISCERRNDLPKLKKIYKGFHQLSLEQEYRGLETGKFLGIHSANIFLWIREFRHDQDGINEGGFTKQKLQVGARRLRKEIKHLERESEILKKAVVFFAKKLN